MERTLKCPVCGKPLTQTEYDKALGLWKEKQEHIKHLTDERKKLKEQEKLNEKKYKEQQQEIREQKRHFKHQTLQQAQAFKKERVKLLNDSRNAISKQAKKYDQRLKTQKDQIERASNQKMKVEIKRGVARGIEQERRQFKKQQAALKKSENKMTQLEKSLNISAKKYEQASEEIKKLKEQIEKGITPQIEGLLEEGNLLAKLKELYPHDRFEHPGKGGDIIQTVIEQGKEVGKIVYECKKVKTFNKNHIEQAKEARRLREADYAILVTNAFPTKKQYYFVEKTVFVISPVSLEPITYTLRESLIKMALLKMSNEAKQKAVQKVYDFLSSNEYNNKMNDVAGQLIDLAKVLRLEIASHKKTWVKRYESYRDIYTDIGVIDVKLKGLVQPQLETKPKLLPEPKPQFLQIEELER